MQAKIKNPTTPLTRYGTKLGNKYHMRAKKRKDLLSSVTEKRQKEQKKSHCVAFLFFFSPFLPLVISAQVTPKPKKTNKTIKKTNKTIKNPLKTLKMLQTNLCNKKKCYRQFPEQINIDCFCYRQISVTLHITLQITLHTSVCNI